MRSSHDYLSRVVARDIHTKGVFGQSWKYVERNIKHARWFFCRSPLRVFHDLLWWVKHRTTRRFHVLHIRSLKPGWCDTDHRLLHASFTLLEDYVEREKPFKIIEWNDSDESREFANEIHSLYLWWKRYKTRNERYTGFESINQEDERYREETANLIRLMNIRHVLWT